MFSIAPLWETGREFLGGRASRCHRVSAAQHHLAHMGPAAALIVEMGSKFAVLTRHVSTGVSLKRLPLAEQAAVNAGAAGWQGGQA